MMTIKDVKEMRRNGLNNYEKEQLLDAYTITNATKKTFTTWEKEIKDELENQMNVGDQLSLDFGPNTFIPGFSNSRSVVPKISKEDFISLIYKYHPQLIKHSYTDSSLLKMYDQGYLHTDIIAAFDIIEEQSFSISTKKIKKEEE